MLKIYWLDKYTEKEIRKTISFSKAKEINKQIKNTKQTKKSKIMHLGRNFTKKGNDFYSGNLKTLKEEIRR